MPELNRPLKVFLSYASQDKPLVRELSRRLVGEGWIDTWQDEKSLLPGQDWRVKIEEAVEEADVVIIVLSQHSVSKEGHVQKELRYAREIALEKPEEAIFLIPLRLDECEVPRGLRFYQWVDYFGDNKDPSYKALVASLNFRYEQKIKAENAESLRKELQEREFAEKIAREKAEKDVAEKARLKAEEEERQRIAKEKADREAADKLAREKAEKEVAEKARLLAEEKERQKIAKEKANRDQKIKETRPKKEHEPGEKNRRGASVEKVDQVRKYVKPEIPNPNSGNQVIYWVGGFVILIFVIIILSSLNSPSSNILTPTNAPTKTNTSTVMPTQKIINTPINTPSLTITPTTTLTEVPTESIIPASNLRNLYFITTDNYLSLIDTISSKVRTIEKLSIWSRTNIFWLSESELVSFPNISKYAVGDPENSFSIINIENNNLRSIRGVIVIITLTVLISLLIARF